MNYLKEYNIKDKYNYKYYIYFLIDKDKVVYIGRTGDINLRLKNHFRDKQFNRVFLLYIRKYERAFQLEKRLIEALIPKYNSIGRWKNRKKRNPICLATRSSYKRGLCLSCERIVFIEEIQKIKNWIVEKI